MPERDAREQVLRASKDLEAMVRAGIEKVLTNCARPLFVHEIVRRQRAENPFISSIEIERELLAMLRARVVVEKRKRYSLAADAIKSQPQEELGPEGKPSWDSFRALCKYYIDCLRAEEGAEAYCGTADYGTRFISRPLVGVATPEESSPWHHNYSLDQDLASFLAAKKDDDSAVLGYLLFSARDQQRESTERLVIPVFCLKISIEVRGNTISLTNPNPFIFVNPKFVAAMRLRGMSEETIAAFTQACGDKDASVFPSFGQLAKIFVSFFYDLCSSHSLSPETAVPFSSASGASKDCVLNSAALMLAKRPKYSLRLINELEHIAKQDDQTLSRTSLVSLFGDNAVVDQLGGSPPQSTWLLADADLSYSQRQAAKAILSRRFSSITGPPGSGKSQVVSSIATHCMVQGRSLLFSSYNHKALDAVCERTMLPGDGEFSFLRRFNTPDKQEALRLSAIIDEIKERNHKQFEPEELIQEVRKAEELAARIDEMVAIAERTAVIEEQTNRLESELREVVDGGSEQRFAAVCRFSPAKIISVCDALLRNSIGAKLLRFYHLMFNPRLMRACKEFCANAEDKKSLREGMPRLRSLKIAIELHRKIANLNASRRVQDIGQLSEEYHRTVNDLSLRVKRIVNFRARQPYPPESSLEELRFILRDWKRNIRKNSGEKTWIQRDAEKLKTFLRHYACSAASSLSVGRFFPLVPGLFDYAIIDEAAASTFPSAIPILYRAQRAAVVGDPHQLSPIVQLRDQLEFELRAEHNLNYPWARAYNYKYRSLFDVSESSREATRVFLTDNFRSDPAIVDYSNAIAYGDRIRSCALTSTLRCPRGCKQGIQWIDVKTPEKSARGNISTEEIEKVLAITQRIVRSSAFDGTVGIITPFVDQAKRIEDALEREYDLSKREKHKLYAQTVHAFQGGERDCIIFSLCAGDFLREGAIAFIERDARLFNVAASRAKASLIVVGDLSWAKGSHIEHVRLLGEHATNERHVRPKGPWSPYESPWEQRFAEALIKLGLSPIPQHKVMNRRLDLALIDEDRCTYIDVEVDGCAYHRRSDGLRRTEDLWRNYQLRSLGWRVMRYWVYELREDMSRCALEVKRAFEQGEKK